MQFTTTLKKFNSNLWGHHIIVPEKMALPFVEGDNRRVFCSLNGEHEFHCALMPHGDGDFFININKEIRTKLGLRIGQEVKVVLTKDKSEYGMEMPEELGELLSMDDEGNTFFHALTPGRQRTLIYMVAKPKTTDTRLKKAIVIVEFLKRNKGKLDFKALNEAFKEANRM